jgi:LuxR family maltose regulon positive regulatory protein
VSPALLELVLLRIARGAPDLADLEPRLGEIAGAELPATRSTRWEAVISARLGAGVAAALRQVDARVVDGLAVVVTQIDADGGVPFAVKAHLLMAYACMVHRAGDRARAAMEAALRHARQAQMLRSVDDSGPWARKLVAEIADAAGAPASVQAVPVPAAPEAAAAGASVEPSLREREILELAGRGFSNKEIGKTVQIAPETVKWHVKNVFAKLGVANRMQAVNRARQNQPSA